MISFKDFLQNENVISFSKKKEERDVGNFAKKLRMSVQDRVEQKKQLVAKMKNDGKFPIEIGTRYATSHSDKHGLPPYQVVGYHVDSKNPEDNYGYIVKQSHPDGESTHETHMIRSVRGEEIHGPEKWKAIQKDRRILDGPKG